VAVAAAVVAAAGDCSPMAGSSGRGSTRMNADQSTPRPHHPWRSAL